MRIIAIVLKDLKQIVQEKRSLMILVAMPIVFTLFMGFAYSKSQGDPNADTRLVLAWVDQDNGDVLGKRLETMLSNSESVRLEAMEESSALESVRQGKLAGALLIPSGFSQDRLGERAESTHPGGRPGLGNRTDALPGGSHPRHAVDEQRGDRHFER